jgi:hypothetical protein
MMQGRLELVRGFLTLEEREPVVESKSQAQSQNEVKSRGDSKAGSQGG